MLSAGAEGAQSGARGTPDPLAQGVFVYGSQLIGSVNAGSRRRGIGVVRKEG